MSSYLNFYVVPNEESKPLNIYSITRNNEFYRAFQDSIIPVFAGIDETKYTELTIENIDRVISMYSEEVNKWEKQYQIKSDIVEKLTKVEEETIDELVQTRESLDEMNDVLKELKFVQNLVHEIYSGYTDFKKVLINIS